MNLQIEGIVPVIPTPFMPDESIDDVSLRRVVDFVASRSMAAMCLPAYGSEFYKLDESEREHVIAVALEENRGRVPVFAQANHPAAKVAAALAARYERLGADAIGVALPRQFGGTDDDLLDYVSRVAAAVQVPILVQDFNPGGATIDAPFIAEAHRRHANVRWFKLEEPMAIDKLVRIGDAMGDRVTLLGGWGGLYMLEGMSVGPGIRGVMPGVALCDVFAAIYDDYRAGRTRDAFQRFARLAPWIGFSLQHFELFLDMEKRLLQRRGLIQHAHRRAATRTFSPATQRYVAFLLDELSREFETQR